MSTALQTGALLSVLLGLLCAGLVLARARDVRLSLKVLLEFLLAAGLLRLADDPGWRQLATAASVVAIRMIASYGLRR